MLSNIKSSAIMKIIFSLLNYHRQLEIIKFNQKLQKKLSVDINTYKKEARLFRIRDKKNGTCKIYINGTDELIFEAENIKAGDFNGKEYKKGKLQFEGEYKNSKRNGKGRRYRNNELIFEGIYKDGKEWEGKGIIPDYNNDSYEFFGIIHEGKVNGEAKKFLFGDKKPVYEGNFVDSKKSGFAKEYKDDNLIYEGEFLEDKRNGNGKEYNKKKLIFEGIFLNGERWEGKGIEFSNIFGDIGYEGEYKNGKKNGKGKEYFNERKIKFEGNYIDGKRNGEGIEYFRNGIIKFRGEYLNDVMQNGKGYNLKGEEIYEIENGEGNV